MAGVRAAALRYDPTMPSFHDALPLGSIGSGETGRATVDGFEVAVANVDGEYFAFQNLCPHQGARLGGWPLVDGCFIRCARHSSLYDVRTGVCVEPAPDGFNQDLMVFPTRVEGEVVQVQV